MTLRIVLAPLTHLARPGEALTLCGATTGSRPTLELTAGSDYGEHRDDCVRCAFVWRNEARR